MNCAYLNCLNEIHQQNYVCPHCKKLYYCSQNCQINHWEQTHKHECNNPITTNNITTISDNQSNLDISTISNTSKSYVQKKTLDDYEMITLRDHSSADLGKGSYGCVKLVKLKGDTTNQLFALKIIDKKALMQYSSAENLKREIKIQKKVNHPHIIKLYHYFEDTHNVYLVLEYAENGNLFTYLRKKKKLSEKEAFIYFFQTCVGIDYLHKKSILHRDLKPENLLLDKTGNIKLCDFGWSIESTGKRQTFCGTIDYMAPEMIQNKPHNHKIDIWSLGILLYELIHGTPPFKGKSNDDKFKKILQGEIEFPNASAEAKDLISLLLKANPDDRPEFDVIFNHKWTKKYEQKFKIKINDYIYRPTTKRPPIKSQKTKEIPTSLSDLDSISQSNNLQLRSQTPNIIENNDKNDISVSPISSKAKINIEEFDFDISRDDIKPKIQNNPKINVPKLPLSPLNKSTNNFNFNKINQDGELSGRLQQAQGNIPLTNLAMSGNLTQAMGYIPPLSQPGQSSRVMTAELSSATQVNDLTAALFKKSQLAAQVSTASPLSGRANIISSMRANLQIKIQSRDNSPTQNNRLRLTPRAIANRNRNHYFSREMQINQTEMKSPRSVNLIRTKFNNPNAGIINASVNLDTENTPDDLMTSRPTDIDKYLKDIQSEEIILLNKLEAFHINMEKSDSITEKNQPNLLTISASKEYSQKMPLLSESIIMKDQDMDLKDQGANFLGDTKYSKESMENQSAIKFSNSENTTSLRMAHQAPKSGNQTPRGGNQTPRGGNQTPRGGNHTPKNKFFKRELTIEEEDKPNDISPLILKEPEDLVNPAALTQEKSANKTPGRKNMMLSLQLSDIESTNDTNNDQAPLLPSPNSSQNKIPKSPRSKPANYGLSPRSQPNFNFLSKNQQVNNNTRENSRFQQHQQNITTNPQNTSNHEAIAGVNIKNRTNTPDPISKTHAEQFLKNEVKVMNKPDVQPNKEPFGINGDKLQVEEVAKTQVFNQEIPSVDKLNELPSFGNSNVEMLATKLQDPSVSQQTKDQAVNQMTALQYEMEYNNHLLNPRPFSFGESFKGAKSAGLEKFRENLKDQVPILEENEDINTSRDANDQLKQPPTNLPSYLSFSAVGAGAGAGVGIVGSHELNKFNSVTSQLNLGNIQKVARIENRLDNNMYKSQQVEVSMTFEKFNSSVELNQSVDQTRIKKHLENSPGYIVINEKYDQKSVLNMNSDLYLSSSNIKSNDIVEIRSRNLANSNNINRQNAHSVDFTWNYPQDNSFQALKENSLNPINHQHIFEARDESDRFIKDINETNARPGARITMDRNGSIIVIKEKPLPNSKGYHQSQSPILLSRNEELYLNQKSSNNKVGDSTFVGNQPGVTIAGNKSGAAIPGNKPGNVGMNPWAVIDGKENYTAKKNEKQDFANQAKGNQDLKDFSKEYSEGGSNSSFNELNPEFSFNQSKFKKLNLKRRKSQNISISEVNEYQELNYDNEIKKINYSPNVKITGYKAEPEEVKTVVAKGQNGSKLPLPHQALNNTKVNKPNITTTSTTTTTSTATTTANKLELTNPNATRVNLSKHNISEVEETLEALLEINGKSLNKMNGLNKVPTGNIGSNSEYMMINTSGKNNMNVSSGEKEKTANFDLVDSRKQNKVIENQRKDINHDNSYSNMEASIPNKNINTKLLHRRVPIPARYETESDRLWTIDSEKTDRIGDTPKVSRYSLRNTVQIVGKDEVPKEEPSFFDKLIDLFTCISREPQGKPKKKPQQQQQQQQQPQVSSSAYMKSKQHPPIKDQQQQQSNPNGIQNQNQTQTGMRKNTKALTNYK